MVPQANAIVVHAMTEMNRALLGSDERTDERNMVILRDGGTRGSILHVQDINEMTPGRPNVVRSQKGSLTAGADIKAQDSWAVDPDICSLPQTSS